MEFISIVILLGKTNTINYICKKISQKIGVLKRIRDYVTIGILKMIHNSILLPHIDYGCVIWGRCPNQVNVARICKLQKRAARVMLRCKIQDTSSNEIFKGMNWMPFQERVSYKCWLMMFKVKNNLVPRDICKHSLQSQWCMTTTPGMQQDVTCMCLVLT